MKHKLRKVTNHIPAGEYQGTIIGQNLSSDGRFLWLTIEVEKMNSDLSVCMLFGGVMYFNFAKYLADDNGEVDTDDFLYTVVRFTVEDKKTDDNVYSKLKKFSPVLEEEGEKD